MNTSKHTLYRKGVSYLLLAVMIGSSVGQPLYAAVYANPLDKWLSENIEQYKNTLYYTPSSYNPFSLAQGHDEDPEMVSDESTWAEDEKAASGSAVPKNSSSTANQVAVTKNRSINTAYKAADNTTVYADIASGFIGQDSKTGIADDPSDNVFHFDFKTISPTDAYVLTYEIKGIENASGVITALNENPAQGGKLIKTSDSWVQHTKQLDKNQLKTGFNYVLFNAPSAASVPYQVKNVRIERVSKTEQVVQFDEQPGHFYFHGTSLYVKGKVQQAYAGYELRINHQTVHTTDGYFDTVIPFEAAAPETLSIQCYKGSEVVYSKTEDILSLTKADHVSGITANRLATRSAVYQPQQAYTLNAFEAGIELPAHTLDSAMTISISQLRSVDMAPFGGALFNVTKNRLGYRFLPDGLTFSTAGKIAVPYAKEQLPAGYSEADIQLFYFDVYSKSWQPIPTAGIDTEKGIIYGTTDHFTDYIAGIIQVPQSPETAAFTPTTISDIQIADPSEGIVEIQPPTANQQGDGTLSYPINVPPGRNGLQPQLALQYNNNGGNGWMGQGWELSVPSIEIDTRFGVPPYSTTKETEAYTLMGEELMLNTTGESFYLPHRDNLVNRISNAKFYPKTEGSFSIIERRGTGPANYNWVVRTKDGMTYYYGETTNSRLTTGSGTTGNIARWLLTRMVDSNGNEVNYTYETKTFSGGTVAGGKQIYLTEINYSGGFHKITFERTLNVGTTARTDIGISYRLGFKEITYDLLSGIRIHEKVIPNPTSENPDYLNTWNGYRYAFTYKKGEFNKTLLEELKVISATGRMQYKEVDTHNLETLTFSHTFDYYNDAAGGLFESNSISMASPNDHQGKYEEFGVTATAIGGGEGKNKQFSASGAPGLIYVALPASYLPISNAGTFYYSPSWSESETETMVSLIDMDGDGLPDKLFKTGGKLNYRKNMGHGFSDYVVPVEGDLGRMVYSTSKTNSDTFSFNVAFGAVDKSKSEANNRVHSYFEDVNADGLMDMVQNGTVLFNRIDPNTRVPVYSNTSLNTPNVIRKEGDVHPDAINALPPLDNANSLMDLVKVWKAPATGKINITGTITKNHVSLPNGIRYSIEKRARTGTLLSYQMTYIKEPSLMLVGSEGTNFTNIEVKKGDMLFFRVNTTHIPEEDVEVTWSPRVTYTTSNFDSPNRYKQYSSSYDEAYILSMGSDYVIKKPGNYYIGFPSFTINNASATAPELSDDVFFKYTVYKINQNVSSGQNPMQVISTGQRRAKPNVNNTISLPNTVINGAGVNENDGDSYIYVKVEAIAYSEVNWKLISEKFRPFIIDTTGQKNIITPSLRNYANTHTNYYHSNFDNTGVGIVVLNNFNLANYGCSDGSCKDQYVYLVVKNKYGKIRNYMSGDMKIRYKIGASGNVVECFRFERNSGEYVDNFNPNEKQALTYITEDQDVYVEMYTDEYALAQKLRNYQQDHNFIELSGNNAPGKTTYVEGGTPAQNRGLYKLNIYSGTNTKGFGPFYRHWGQFAYKGPQPGETFEKIDYNSINLEALTALHNISEEGQSDSTENLQDLMDADPSVLENMTFDQVAAQYPTTVGVAQKLGVLMPDANKNAWSLNERLFIQNEKMSPYTRYVEGQEIPLPPLNIYDNDNLYGAVGIIKTSRNESESSTLSLGFGNFSVANTKTKSNNFVYNDHRDINGDGYPDIVGEKIQLTSNKGGLSNTLVNTNVLQNSVTDGSGQGAGGGMAQVVSTFGMNGSTVSGASRVGTIGFSMGINGQGFDSTDKANQTVIDINGDGLADIIQQNGTVRLNTGTTFVAQNSWGTTFANTTSTKTKSGGISGGGSFGPNGNFSNADIAFGLSISTSDTKEQDTYFDVNGDGLPDQITGGGTVRINTGSGFSTQTYALPQAMMQSSSNAGISANATGCFTFIFPPLFILGFKICLGAGGAKGHVVNQEKVRYMDMNGDGYPDLVTSENDDQLNVRLSRIRRTNMLKTVHRPMGGTLTLDYSTRNGYANTEVGSTFKMPFKKWVLSRVEVNDGVSGDGQDVMKYAFEYEGGFKDRRERKFMGFGTVKTHQLKADGSIYRSTITEYWLSQMKDTEPYLPSQHADIRKYQYLKDLVIREYTQDEYQRIPNEKSYSYGIKQARIPALNTTAQPYEMNGSSFTNFTETSRVVPLVAQIKTITRNFDEDNGNAALELVHIERFKEYDKFGNPLVYIDDTDNVTVNMRYHYNFTKYNVVIPMEHIVYSNAETRKSTTTVDGNNNITAIQKQLDSSQAARYDMVYDSYGNLTKITYPKPTMGASENSRMWYAYTYDTASATHVNKIEDAYGYSSKMITDYWGRTVTITDANKKTLFYLYDGMGRLEKIGLEADHPNSFLIKHAYYPYAQTGQLSYAVTHHKIGGTFTAPLIVSTSAFSDGLGRIIQTKKQLEKDCTPATNTGYRFAVSGRVEYDEFGRAVDTYLSQEAASCTSGTPDTFLRTFTPLTHTANEKTTNRYDHRDRIIQTRVHGLDATTRIKYAFGDDGFGKKQFTKDVVLPEGNRTITYTDIKGRTTTTKQIGDGQELQTLFTYDGLSQLKDVRDAADQVTSYAYDALGRKTSVIQPTSGKSNFTYDLAGRLVKSQNEKLINSGQTINYNYHFNQLTGIDYPSHSVVYKYGSAGDPDNGAGRLVYQSDLTGTQTFKYGNLGEVKENTRTITDENGQVMEFVTKSKYDEWGRILAMTYPDGEELTYQYNTVGQLTGITSSQTMPISGGVTDQYIKNVKYNYFDQPVYIEYGNGMKTKNEYDITQRLRAMQLGKNNQSVVMRNVYEYDRNQNVKRIDNNYSQASQFFIGGTYKNDYVYDGFNRLKSANGSWAGYQRTDDYSVNMSYTPTHGIQVKEQFHKKTTPTVTEETENSYEAHYEYSNHPHRPDNIKYADHIGNTIGSKSIKYDANGNMEYIGTSDAYGNVERKMLWDEQNRLIGVIDNDTFYNQYIYDAGGERVLKKAVAVSNVNINGSAAITIGSFEDYTLYPSGYLVVGPNRYTKHYYANGKKIASKMVEMPTNVFLQSANFSRVPGESQEEAVQQATAAPQASDDNMPDMQSFNYVAYSTPQSDASCQSQITTLIELYTDPEGLLIDCKNQIVAIKNQYPDNPCLALELIHQIECVAICPDCPPGGGPGNSDPECPTCPEVDPNPIPEPTPDEVLLCLQDFSQYWDVISNPANWIENPDLNDCYWKVMQMLKDEKSYCEIREFILGNPDMCRIKVIFPVIPETPDIPEEGEDDWQGETPVNPTPTPELPPSYVANVWWYHSDHLGSSSYLSDNYSRLSHYYYYLPFGETMVEQNFSGYNNAFKFNGKEQDPETGMMYYGARYYDPKMSLFVSVDPLAEQFQGWSPYNYTLNNPLNWTDPTGMAPDDWIDINKKTGGIKITKSEGADVVRLVDDGKVVDSYEYGENGSFRKDNKVERNGLFERTGYKVHFQDATKADKFFKLAAKSDVEFASMNFFFGDNVTGQSTVLTSGSSQSVSGTAYAYEVLRENPDAYLLNFSHSHPGKYNPKTNYPAAPSGFNYTDLKTNNYNGDRQRYLEGSKEFGNRIPHYFNIYIPGNPNVKVKHNGQKAIRTITR